MACKHGMQGNCSICSGVGPLKVEQFIPRHVEDDTPRLAKMRGKVEWRGRGQMLLGSESYELQNAAVLNESAAAVPGTRITDTAPGTFADIYAANLAKHTALILTRQAETRERKSGRTEIVKWGDRTIEVSRVQEPGMAAELLPKGTYRPAPRLIKHARNPGRTATAAHANRRT